MSRSMSHNCQFALFEIKPHRVMQGTCFCYNLEKSEKNVLIYSVNMIQLTPLKDLSAIKVIHINEMPR